MIMMNGGARTLTSYKRGFDGMLRKPSTIFRERTRDQSRQRDNIRDLWSHLFISLSPL
jgi:hypothetical protein